MEKKQLQKSQVWQTQQIDIEMDWEASLESRIWMRPFEYVKETQLSELIFSWFELS